MPPLDIGGFPQAGGPVLVDRFGSPLRARGGAIYAYHRTDQLTAAGFETVMNLSQPPGPFSIHKNGTRLNSSQYTLSGAQVTFASALATSDVIVVDAWSVYPMTAPALVASTGDSLFAFRKSLLHFEGTNGSSTFTDVIGNVWTAGNSAQISTGWSAFGSASGLFSNGSNLGYIQTPDAPALQPGTQDFCIEWQIRYNVAFGNYMNIIAKGYVGAGDFLIQTDTSATGKINVYFSGSVVLVDPGPLTSGQRYFMRVRRSGTSLTFERDGVTTATATNSTNLNGTQTLSIGSRSVSGVGNSYYLQANVDEFRYTVGNAGLANIMQTASWPDHA